MLKDIKTLLKNPAAAYRAKPFWSWNGDLEEQELLRQIDAMKEMGFGGFFMHSRTGLQTEYMGEEWFRLIRRCAEYGAAQGMEVWLYDEDRWPSGTCGGLVTENPDFRMRYISEYDSDEDAFAAPDFDKIIARYAVLFKGDRIADIKEVSCTAETPAGYSYLVYAEERMACDDFYNGAAYLDTMNADAVDAFLASTHGVYAARCGEMFGKEIKGIFTDEPHRGAVFSGFSMNNANRARMIPYTGGAFARYREKYGEAVCVPDLYYFREGKEESETSYRYLDVLDDLFTENYAKKYGDWCRSHDLLFTGHILHEDNLCAQASLSGSMMRFYEYMDCPGVDNLGLHNNCYFAAIQCASAARQTGKKFVLSELYGCTGWDMPLREYKRLGDWQALFGINLRCPHLSWYTMKGQAKRDYPTSILHQNAWYRDWALLEEYFGRIGMILTEGEREADVLVVHPIEQMWRYVRKGWLNVFTSDKKEVQGLEKEFAAQCAALIAAQIEFDYGDEELMCKYGSIGKDEKGACLRVGRCTYRSVVAAEGVKLRAGTQKLLRAFREAGGTVVPDANGLRPRLLVTAPDGVAGAVRKWNGDFWLFLLNLKDEETAGELVPAGGLLGLNAEEWDLVRLENLGAKDLKNLRFLPNEMRIFRFTEEGVRAAAAEEASEAVLPERMPYVLEEPNVLVLDRARFRLNGEPLFAGEEKDVLLADAMLRDRFGLSRRGGTMVQPWFRKKYGGEEEVFGKVEISYRFRSEIEGVFRLAAEYGAIAVNGVPAQLTDERWTDCAFRVFAVPVKKGENIISAEICFSRSADIEAVYLLGGFAVRMPGTLIPLPETLARGDIAPQGFPFYSGAIEYRTGIRGKKVRVRLPDLAGTTLHVLGGEREEVLFLPPYEAVADLKDELRLKLYFTRRNTFGPHHLTPQPQEAYGPEAWVSEGENRTEDYVLIPQGL